MINEHGAFGGIRIDAVLKTETWLFQKSKPGSSASIQSLY
jgi:hypothetical protein